MNKLEQAARQAQIAISDAVNALLFLARDCEMRNSAIDIGNAAISALREALDGQAEHTPYCKQAPMCKTPCGNPDCVEQAEQELVRKWPLMGYGNVAIGGGKQPDGTPCLLYMDMGETREIGTDTTDIFSVGSEADPTKLLACIYFKDGAAIQQTIDVLEEMQVEIGYAAPVRTKDLTDDEIEECVHIADSECTEDACMPWFVEFARAVIAKDRELNK